MSKKLDEQRNTINAQHQNETQTIKGEYEFNCDAIKKKASKTQKKLLKKYGRMKKVKLII